MSLFSDDFRTAFRQFAQAPLLTLTAVISLAAALGAGTLLSPVAGVADAERMVEIGRTTQSYGFDSLSLANLRDLEQRSKTTESIYGHSALTMSRMGLGDFILENGEAVSAGVNVVSGVFFETLQIPVRGRTGSAGSQGRAGTALGGAAR